MGAQLKKKVKPNYQIRYQNWIQLTLKDRFTSSDFDSDTDTDSNWESDFASLINNASETEQIISDNETKLINDETTIINNASETEQIASDNKDKTTDKIVDNSNETDNKMLIVNINAETKLQTETPDNKLTNLP